MGYRNLKDNLKTNFESLKTNANNFYLKNLDKYQRYVYLYAAIIWVSDALFFHILLPKSAVSVL